MIVEGTIEGLVEDRGFGFISAPGLSKNIFFHFSCLHGVRFEDLQKDSRVHVEYEDGPRGLAATSVRIMDGAIHPLTVQFSEYDIINNLTDLIFTDT